MRRSAVLLVILALGPACSTSPKPATSTTSPDTSGSSVTTTLPASSTASTSATPTTSPTTTLPEASECAPGTEELPDGLWFGFVAEADETTLEFDLACWFSGDAAIEATTEDGEESPPPNDYYVRNESPTLRNLPVTEDLTVTWYPSGDPTAQRTTSYAVWLEERAALKADTEMPGFPFGVWINTESGEVMSLNEQWVP